MSKSAMSWYYSANVKAILHSAAIVKIVFHPHRNSLLQQLKDSSLSLNVFKRKLKTHFFIYE